MALTLEQVRHVATLARLALTPEEEQRFATQLSAVLDFSGGSDGREASSRNSEAASVACEVGSTASTSSA